MPSPSTRTMGCCSKYSKPRRSSGLRGIHRRMPPMPAISVVVVVVVAAVAVLAAVLAFDSRSSETRRTLVAVSAWSGGAIARRNRRDPFRQQQKKEGRRERPRTSALFPSATSVHPLLPLSSSARDDDKASASSSSTKEPSKTTSNRNNTKRNRQKNHNSNNNDNSSSKNHRTKQENGANTNNRGSGGGRSNAKRKGQNASTRQQQQQQGRGRQPRHSGTDRRRFPAKARLPHAPPTTVSQLVQDLRTIMHTRVRAAGGRGKGRVRDDWRTAWSLLRSEATIRSSDAASPTSLEGHTTILPVRVYHEILKCMEHDAGCWQDAIKLVRYMETGGGGEEDDGRSAGDAAREIEEVVYATSPSVPPVTVDKYNSKPWHIPEPNYEIYHTLLECLSRNGGGRHDAHDASVYWFTKMLRKLERDLVEIARQKAAASSDDREEIDGTTGSIDVVLTNRDRKLVRNSLQLILGSLSKQRKWREALRLLEYAETMCERGEIPLTVVQYNTVLTCLARCYQVGQCQRLLQRLRTRSRELMRERAYRTPTDADDDFDRDDDFRRSSAPSTRILQPDEISYNAVIGACASAGRTADALKVLDECYREPGVDPNIYIYTNAMRACAKGGNTQRALSLLQVVKDKELPVDSYCYTAVIDACAKGKQWKKALELFDEMVDRGIQPTQVTYSATISALGNGLQWERALSLLNLMRDQGMKVNLITYNAAITALAKSSKNKHSAKLSNSGTAATTHSETNGTGSGSNNNNSDDDDDEELWSKALALLQQMEEDGIEPDGFCYSSAINCCGAEGRWKEACDLIETMKRGGPKSRPNKVAYTAAINACGRAGQGAKALELFQEMRDDGLAADRVAYNALFSALRVSKDADKAYELWGEICGRTQQSSFATAKDTKTSPDVITLTDCIATLSRAGRTEQMDTVFREAVDRGIVLGRNNDLDEAWEIDLSGMSLPIARAATRYLLQTIVLKNTKHRHLGDRDRVDDDEDNNNNNKDDDVDDDYRLQDMVFITGIGKAQQKRREKSSSSSSSSSRPGSASSTKHGVLDRKDKTTSLRDFIRGILETDLDPPLASMVPERARGTVVIEEETLRRWLEDENGRVAAVVVAATTTEGNDDNDANR